MATIVEKFFDSKDALTAELSATLETKFSQRH